MPSSRFMKILLVEVLIVGVIGAYFLIDSRDIYRWWVGDTRFVVASKECDLQKQTCSALLENNTSLSFDISPKPILPAKPLHFKVHAPTISLPEIELKIFATNMNMGLHTFKLLPTQNGWYEGDGILPTCMVGDMIWQVNVIFNSSDKSLGSIFYFQTAK